VPKEKLKSISPKHSRIAFYIARGFDQESVARRFGVHPVTLRKYMGDELFKKEVTRIQKQIEDRSLILMEDALDPIHKALKDFSTEIVRIAKESKSDNSRLKAIELGYNLTQPALEKEKDKKKQQPELRMKIEMVKDAVSKEPEFKIVESGAK